MTSQAHCSICDADIGTGKSDGSLCLSFCNAWFYACENEFFDPYIEVSEDVPFCREDSLICSPMREVANNSKDFCQKMGFKVISPRQNQFFDDELAPKKGNDE